MLSYESCIVLRDWTILYWRKFINRLAMAELSWSETLYWQGHDVYVYTLYAFSILLCADGLLFGTPSWDDFGKLKFPSSQATLISRCPSINRGTVSWTFSLRYFYNAGETHYRISLIFLHEWLNFTVHFLANIWFSRRLRRLTQNTHRKLACTVRMAARAKRLANSA